MAWLTGWTYRKSHAITGSSGAGTNYQIRVHVYYSGTGGSGEDVYTDSHCATDFGDVRFTDDTGSGLLDYWLESKTDSNNAIFWVEVADDLSSDQSIYIYYGKASETTTSNGTNTFPFFDHFDDSWPDGLWNGTTALGSVSSSILTCTGNGSWRQIYSASYISGGTAACRARINPSTPTSFNHLELGAYGQSVNRASFVHSSIGHQISTWDDSTHSEVTSNWNSGSYRVYDIQVVSDTSAKFLEDETNVTGSPKTTNPSGPANTYVCFNSGTAGTDFTVDWVLLRKYVATEPAHSTWGSEETEAAYHIPEIFHHYTLLTQVN